MPDAPAGDNANQNQNPDDKPITKAELLALLQSEVPKVVNSAVTNHTKRLSKDWEDRFAKLAPSKPAEGGEEAGEGGHQAPPGGAAGAQQTPPGQTPPRQPDPEVESLKKVVASLKGEVTKEREARTKAERARIEEAGYAALKSALSGKVLQGVEGDIVDLFKARGRVQIADDGTVTLKGLRADEPEDWLPLADGVAEFLKSPSAQHYLPPPAANQRGGRAPFGAKPGSKTTPTDAFTAKFGATPEEILARG